MLFFTLFMIIQICLASESVIPPLSSLTLDEKIGQLFIMATSSDIALNAEFIKTSPYNLDPDYARKMIEKYHVGGIIFLGNGIPSKQAALTKTFQEKSAIPLLIALDAEWGLGMRLIEDAISFPRALTLGALNKIDESIIYRIGMEIGRQCKAIGIDCAMAPVADVNSNPENPIINVRSFGENAERVARKATLFSQGLQAAGIVSCAKHFPGHGDTSLDSHLILPIVLHKKERLESTELVPFKRLIKNNVDIIMTSHLAVPELEKNKSVLVPATVSYAIVTQLLREKLNFTGVVITDGLGMKGIADLFPPGELELKALQAGHDLLLCPTDIPRAFARIKQAMKEGEFSEKKLNEHVERILNLKRKAHSSLRPEYDKNYFQTSECLRLKEQAYRAAITLLRNDLYYVPLLKNTGPFLVLSNSTDTTPPFVSMLSQSLSITYRNIAQEAPETMYEEMTQLCNHYAIIITCIHAQGRSGMIEECHKNSQSKSNVDPYLSLINALGNKAIIVLFASPYNLKYFKNSKTVIVAYENEPEAQKTAAAVILGEHNPRGTLPVSSNSHYQEGMGLSLFI